MLTGFVPQSFVSTCRYQLAFRTPGISPFEAKTLKQILQIWNFR